MKVFSALTAGASVGVKVALLVTFIFARVREKLSSLAYELHLEVKNSCGSGGCSA